MLSKVGLNEQTLPLPSRRDDVLACARVAPYAHGHGRRQTAVTDSAVEREAGEGL